jgi:CBS domain-containing protein
MQQNMQVMTPNPECVIIDTPIVDALHTMHDGKFLHLPVVDRGKVNIYRMGNMFACASISFLIWVLVVGNRWHGSGCGRRDTCDSCCCGYC